MNKKYQNINIPGIPINGKYENTTPTSDIHLKADESFALKKPVKQTIY